MAAETCDIRTLWPLVVLVLDNSRADMCWLKRTLMTCMCAAQGGELYESPSVKTMQAGVKSMQQSGCYQLSLTGRLVRVFLKGRCLCSENALSEPGVLLEPCSIASVERACS